MKGKKYIERFALCFAACSLLLVIVALFYQKHQSPPAQATSAIHDSIQTPYSVQISLQKSTRGKVYIPYSEVIQNQSTLIAQLNQRYKNTKVGEPSTEAKGIVHRVNLAPCDSCKTLFLTLDACITRFDSTLIKYLINNNIKATLFITAKWIGNNPQAVKLLRQHLNIFDIENHGALHEPACVSPHTFYGIQSTKNIGELVAEVKIGSDFIENYIGVKPCFFRSGTAFADNVAVKIINDMGCRFIGFSLTADEGATLSHTAVTKRILSAKHGDIVLFHFNSKTGESGRGFIEACEQMKRKKICVKFEKLSNYSDKLVAY